MTAAVSGMDFVEGLDCVRSPVRNDNSSSGLENANHLLKDRFRIGKMVQGVD